jgi:chromosome segregation ATPase
MPCKKCKDGKYKYGNTGECKYDTKEECDKDNPKKYNKMKQYPTPLGKKTYEEYAKELKEFNLSAEPKLQKVELGLAQDLEKARKQSETLIKKSKKTVDKIDKARKSYSDLWEKTRTETGDIENQIKVNNDRIKDAKSAAKELGVNVNDIKGVALLEEANKDLSREINMLKYPPIR